MELTSVLMSDCLRQRWVGRHLLGHRSDADRLEATVDSDRGWPAWSVAVAPQPALQRRFADRTAHVLLWARREGRHHRIRCSRLKGWAAEGAVQFGFEHLSIDHDQLSVKTVQRAQAQVTVLQQLAQRDVAVKRPTEQRLDRGGLKQLVRQSLDVDPIVAQEVDVQGVEEFQL